MSTSLSTYTYVQAGTPTGLSSFAKRAPSGADVNCTPFPTAIITTIYTWFQLGDGCPGGYSFSGTPDGPATCLWTSSRDILNLTWNCLFTVTKTTSTIMLTEAALTDDRLTNTNQGAQAEAIITSTVSIKLPAQTVTVTTPVSSSLTFNRRIGRVRAVSEKLTSNVRLEANLSSLYKRSCTLGQVLCNGGQCCGSGLGACIASWLCCSGAFDCVSFSPSQPFEEAAQDFISAGTVTKEAASSRVGYYSRVTTVSTETAFMSVDGSQGTWTGNQTSSAPATAPVSSSSLSVGGKIGVCFGTVLGAGLLASLIFFVSYRFRRKKMRQFILETNPPRPQGHLGADLALHQPASGTASGAFGGHAQTYFQQPGVLHNAGMQRENLEDRPHSVPLLSRNYGLERGIQSNADPFGRWSDTVDVRTNFPAGAAQHPLPILSEPSARELLAATQSRRLQLESSIEAPLPTHQEGRRPPFLPEPRKLSPLQIDIPTETSRPKISIPRKSVGSRSRPPVRQGLQKIAGSDQTPPIIEEAPQNQQSVQAPSASQTPSSAEPIPFQQREGQKHTNPPRSSAKHLSSGLALTSHPPNLSSVGTQAQTSNGIENSGGKKSSAVASGASGPTSAHGPNSSHYASPTQIWIPNKSESQPVSPAQSLSPLSHISSQRDTYSPLSPATPAPAHSALQIRSLAELPTPATTSYRPATPPYLTLPVSQFNPVAHLDSEYNLQSSSSPFTSTSSPQHAERILPGYRSTGRDISQPPRNPQLLPRGPQGFPSREEQRLDAPSLPDSLAPSRLGYPSDTGGLAQQRGPASIGVTHRVESDGEGERRPQEQGEHYRLQTGRHGGTVRESYTSSIGEGHTFDELPPGLPGFYGA